MQVRPPSSVQWAAAALVVTLLGCGHPKPHGGDNHDGGGDGAVNGDDAGMTNGHVIVITTTVPGTAGDGLCSLAEAVAVANNGTQGISGDCPAAPGTHVIELSAGRYEVTAPLTVTAAVEVRGAGMRTSIVSLSSQPSVFSGCGITVAAPGREVRLTSLALEPTQPANTDADAGADASRALTGACVTGGTLRIRHARVHGFTGGGLRAKAANDSDAKLEVFNALIDGNRNAGDGGGIAFVGAASWIVVHQSAIVGNTSGGMGGGVFAFGGTNANYIINSTVSGNLARHGGGVGARILDLTYVGLVGTTVTDNRALETGGGFAIRGSPGGAGRALAIGAILAGNTADGDAAQANLNADWEGNFSCTDSIVDVSGLERKPGNFMDSCLFDVVDPKLGPLMDMGGVDHLPVHALLPGSPAIDAVAEERSTEPLEQRSSWNSEAGDPPLGTNPGEVPPWTLFGRIFEGNVRTDMGAFEFNPRWEVELLTTDDLSPKVHRVVTEPAGLSHGAGARLDAAGAGTFVTYQVPVPAAGRYVIAAQIRTASDAGRWRLAISDAPAGPYLPIGTMQDGYSNVESWQLVELGVVEITSPGQKLFRFEVTGRNDASAGYTFTADYLMVTKQ